MNLVDNPSAILQHAIDTDQTTAHELVCLIEDFVKPMSQRHAAMAMISQDGLDMETKGDLRKYFDLELISLYL